MTNEEKLEALCEVFENPEINAETQLDEIGWDSMAMLSVMAIAKQNGKTITGSQMREMETVGDILQAL